MLPSSTTKTEMRIATEEQKSFVHNLIPFYIYDMSEYMGWGPNKTGQYGGCDEFIESWGRPDHTTYLIYEEDSVAGFAGVHPYPKEPENRIPGILRPPKVQASECRT